MQVALSDEVDRLGGSPGPADDGGHRGRLGDDPAVGDHVPRTDLASQASNGSVAGSTIKLAGLPATMP